METPPPMGGYMDGWVDWWVNGWGRINLDLIKILFDDLLRHLHGCMGQWVGSDQMTTLIKLEIINII